MILSSLLMNTVSFLAAKRNFGPTSSLRSRAQFHCNLMIPSLLIVSELLNQQFKFIFTNEPSSNLPDNNPSPHSTMPGISVTCQGIENWLNSLQTHKAIDPNAISVTILRATSDIIAPILQIIFQTSLNTTRVPTDQTTALVTIFKTGSCTLPSAQYLLPVLLQRYLSV